MKWTGHILLVDDEPALREGVRELLAGEGYAVEVVDRGPAALDRMREAVFDLVITDLVMPDVDGMALLKWIREHQTQTQVIMITGHSTVESAVEAMQKGAFHYLAKPFQLNELRMVVRRALDAARLQRENVSLRRELEHYTPPEEIIGDNPALRHVLDAVNRIAPTESPVLVCGETGTGKELMARRIHRLSLRADRSFVTVNCAALPDALLESELFGHVKGAFTGARDSRDGLFLAADGGTLFMDEIGDVGPTAQARLLRVLESGEIRRVGEDACRYTDVRLIAATNRDLQEDVRNGAFRDDLYHRINVITLTMPPLRRRRTDIPVLAEHFARLTARLDRQEFAGFDEDVLRAFQQYDWPGNVRELLNVVRRAVILSGGRRVGAHELPAGLRAAAGGDADAPGTQPEGESLEAVERQHIIDVLRSTGGNKSRAAEILGISRPTLRAKLARYAISPKDSL